MALLMTTITNHWLTRKPRALLRRVKLVLPAGDKVSPFVQSVL